MDVPKHLGNKQPSKAVCRLRELSTIKLLAGTDTSVVLVVGLDNHPYVLKAARHMNSDRTSSDSSTNNVNCSSHETRARREVDLLQSEYACSGVGSASFVVRLYGYVIQNSVTSILLDYLPGGSLATLLERNGAFGAHAARYYTACCALALEGLHERGVMHRDVKTENVCIDSDGFAILIDLGFARSFTDGRATTLLGTPEMIAPEIFLGEGHSFPVDLWALGVVLYECLMDATPFFGETPDEVYGSALRSQPAFPESAWKFPEAAKRLVTSLLARCPEARPSPTAVLEHDFFDAGAYPNALALDVKALRQRLVPPPFVPHLSHAFDTSHFDSGSLDTPLWVDSVKALQEWQEQFYPGDEFVYLRRNATAVPCRACSDQDVAPTSAEDKYHSCCQVQ